MAISSHRLWRPYCRQTAWICSHQASQYSPIQEASFPFAGPQHRSRRHLYPRITDPRPELDPGMLSHVPHPRADTQRCSHITCNPPGLCQASYWPPCTLGAPQSFPSRCRLHYNNDKYGEKVPSSSKMEGDDLQQHIQSHSNPLQMHISRFVCPCSHRLGHPWVLHQLPKIGMVHQPPQHL